RPTKSFLPLISVSLNKCAPDIYFFFCGWHLLYSIYMVIGIPGTGTAGLILTIIAFKHGHIVAGVFCVIALVGWVIQTVGNAFYYHKVRLVIVLGVKTLINLYRRGYTTIKLGIP
ncbi:5596_t:CDS:1, partial [Acaulospora colombiana]